MHSTKAGKCCGRCNITVSNKVCIITKDVKRDLDNKKSDLNFQLV